jgi:hypothetical protein
MDCARLNQILQGARAQINRNLMVPQPTRKILDQLKKGHIASFSVSMELNLDQFPYFVNEAAAHPFPLVLTGNIRIRGA